MGNWASFQGPGIGFDRKRNISPTWSAHFDEITEYISTCSVNNVRPRLQQIVASSLMDADSYHLVAPFLVLLWKYIKFEGNEKFESNTIDLGLENYTFMCEPWNKFIKSAWEGNELYDFNSEFGDIIFDINWRFEWEMVGVSLPETYDDLPEEIYHIAPFHLLNRVDSKKVNKCLLPIIMFCPTELIPSYVNTVPIMIDETTHFIETEILQSKNNYKIDGCEYSHEALLRLRKQYLDYWQPDVDTFSALDIQEDLQIILLSKYPDLKYRGSMRLENKLVNTTKLHAWDETIFRIQEYNRYFLAMKNGFKEIENIPDEQLLNRIVRNKEVHLIDHLVQRNEDISIISELLGLTNEFSTRFLDLEQMTDMLIHTLGLRESLMFIIRHGSPYITQGSELVRQLAQKNLKGEDGMERSDLISLIQKHEIYTLMPMFCEDISKQLLRKYINKFDDFDYIEVSCVINQNHEDILSYMKENNCLDHGGSIVIEGYLVDPSSEIYRYQLIGGRFEIIAKISDYGLLEKIYKSVCTTSLQFGALKQLPLEKQVDLIEETFTVEGKYYTSSFEGFPYPETLIGHSGYYQKFNRCFNRYQVLGYKIKDWARSIEDKKTIDYIITNNVIHNDYMYRPNYLHMLQQFSDKELREWYHETPKEEEYLKGLLFELIEFDDKEYLNYIISKANITEVEYFILEEKALEWAETDRDKFKEVLFDSDFLVDYLLNAREPAKLLSVDLCEEIIDKEYTRYYGVVIVVIYELDNIPKTLLKKVLLNLDEISDEYNEIFPLFKDFDLDEEFYRDIYKEPKHETIRQIIFPFLKKEEQLAIIDELICTEDEVIAQQLAHNILEMELEEDQAVHYLQNVKHYYPQSSLILKIQTEEIFMSYFNSSQRFAQFRVQREIQDPNLLFQIISQYSVFNKGLWSHGIELISDIEHLQYLKDTTEDENQKKLLEEKIQVLRLSEPITTEYVLLMHLEDLWKRFHNEYSLPDNYKDAGISFQTKGYNCTLTIKGGNLPTFFLQFFSSEVFSQSPWELKSLILRENKLNSLPSCIGDLTDLEDLDLYGNNLSSLPEIIGNLKKLKVLNLFNNNLSELPESMNNLRQIRELNLWNNQLEIIPDWVGNMTNLETLVLYSNKLTALPEWLGNLVNLEVLDLRSNRITVLPESIGKLTNLRKLNLNRNNLTSLPGSIGSLTKLRKLDLTDNRLTSLHESLGNLSNLQQLFLNGQRISILPATLGNLTNLERLDMEIHTLYSIPEWIKNFTKIRELNLKHNQIKKLPDWIDNLTKLEKFDLSYNNLESLSPNLSELTNLTSLDLKNNRLNNLHVDFSKLLNLKVLILSQNQLNKLPKSIGNLINLKLLRLNDNILTSLPENITNLVNLETLDLSFNNLTELSPDLLKLKNIQIIDLFKNPLNNLPKELQKWTDRQYVFQKREERIRQYKEQNRENIDNKNPKRSAHQEQSSLKTHEDKKKSKDYKLIKLKKLQKLVHDYPYRLHIPKGFKNWKVGYDLERARLYLPEEKWSEEDFKLLKSKNPNLYVIYI